MNSVEYIYIVIGLVSLTLSISLDSFALSQIETSSYLSPKQSRSPKSIRGSHYKLPKNINKKQGSLSGDISASYSQKAIDQKDGSNTNDGSLMAGFGYKVSDSWSVGSSVGYKQDFKDAETTSNGLTDLGLTFKLLSLPDFKYYSQILGFNSVIPLSKQSRDMDGLNTSLGIRYSLSSISKWLIPGFSYYLSLSANKNFHQYEDNKGRNILTSYSLRESAGVSFDFSKSLSVSADLSHSHKFNYEGRVNEGISHSQEIDYEIIPEEWSVALGHSNEGPWFKENGEDLNLEAISDDNSVFYVQTRVSF